MIVIDTSAFSKFLLKEENWDNVLPYLDPNLEPHSVDMLIVEGANVIWKYAEKYRGITKEQAFELYKNMMRLVDEKVIVVEPSKNYLKRSLEIAMEYDIPVYDSLFLSQAKALKAKLVTSDKGQERLAKEIEIDVVFIE